MTDNANASPAPWDCDKSLIVYNDGFYTLGQENGLPYLIAGGKRFTLTSHPYEPCLYITDGSGLKTTVRNAFEPFPVLESFYNGRTVTSVTGFRYNAKDFCRMVEYASGMGNTGIEIAEKVFGDRVGGNARAEKTGEIKSTFSSEASALQEADGAEVITDKHFSDIISGYPDLAVDYCIVKTGQVSPGPDVHRSALVRASRELFFDGEEIIWNYDCSKAIGKQIPSSELFAPANEERCVNYRGAFLYPPWGAVYSEKDLDRVNSTLFPNGTDHLEVYKWSTDWSQYFDDGREWWGTLCLTVYDKSLGRFAVILASATD